MEMVLYRNISRISRGLLLITLYLIFFPIPARADIFTYIDRNGIIHFTNVPTAADCRVFIKEKKAKIRYSVPDLYDHFISAAAENHGVSFSLLKAVIKAESDFNPMAVSPKGAVGLMQIMPQNFQLLNVSDPYDPWENIMGGAEYLRYLLDIFDGELSLALAAYNAGPTRVQRCKGIPPIRETKEYVQRVMKYYQYLLSRK
jgi:soluble lytic murein transglycosylase